MTVLRLAPRNLVADQVFDAILEAIMRGELPTGARLQIRDLAETLGTSPMPVRDAITRLEQTGIVARVPHKGAVVTCLTPEELVSIYDTRLLLEREATRLGSERLSPAGAARMSRHLEKMNRAVAAGRRAEALDCDESLLTVLYAASGNDVLVGMAHGLWRRCRAYKLFGVEGATNHLNPEIWAFQEPLVAAAAAHDAEAAVAIVDRSLGDATARIRAMLEP